MNVGLRTICGASPPPSPSSSSPDARFSSSPPAAVASSIAPAADTGSVVWPTLSVFSAAENEALMPCAPGASPPGTTRRAAAPEMAPPPTSAEPLLVAGTSTGTTRVGLIALNGVVASAAVATASDSRRYVSVRLFLFHSAETAPAAIASGCGRFSPGLGRDPAASAETWLRAGALEM